MSTNADTCESQRWHGSMYLKHLGITVVHLHLKIINKHCHRVKGDPFISAAWPQDTFSILFLWITYFFWNSYQFKQFSSFSMKCCLYKDVSNRRYAISSYIFIANGSIVWETGTIVDRSLRHFLTFRKLRISETLKWLLSYIIKSYKCRVEYFINILWKGGGLLLWCIPNKS